MSELTDRLRGGVTAEGLYNGQIEYVFEAAARLDALEQAEAALAQAQAGWGRCAVCEYEWRVTVPDGVENECPICVLMDAHAKELAQAQVDAAGERMAHVLDYERDRKALAQAQAERDRLVRYILHDGLADRAEGATMTLPWSERVPMLSIHPDAATREDVARLAAENMNLRAALTQVEVGVFGHDHPTAILRAIREYAHDILAGGRP
jgi:multidrug efflux pump subunit AcrA (membrane-fusion protein)